MRRLFLTFALSIIAITTLMAQDIMDVHSHILEQNYMKYLEQNNALLEEGFPLPKWDADSQLKWMDETGIKTAVLTSAAPQPFFGDTVESEKIVRRINEATAEVVKAHLGRFLFCASLPLPDVDAAIREAQYALDTLKASGIKLATNVRGQYLGDPQLDPLMAYLDSKNAVIILHPHKPCPTNELVMRQTPLAMQEYLSETTRVVANMITNNVMARYPHIKFVIPHCGAYLPIAIPRMKSLTPVMEKLKAVPEIDWKANLASLYYDLAGAHSPQAIRLLLTITTPDHLLYGSDYPYVAAPMLTASVNHMKEYLMTEHDLTPLTEDIFYNNAKKLFHLKVESCGCDHLYNVKKHLALTSSE